MKVGKINNLIPTGNRLKFFSMTESISVIFSASTFFSVNSGSDGFWVGKSSLRQWKQMAIDAQNFECMDATDGIIGEPGTWSSKICSKSAIAVKDEKTSVKSEVRKDSELKPNDMGYSCAQDELIMRQNGMETDIGNEVKSSILDNAEEEFDESIEESNNALGMRENTFNSDAQCRNHGMIFPSCNALDNSCIFAKLCIVVWMWKTNLNLSNLFVL